MLRTRWKMLVIALVLPYIQFLGCSIVGLTIGAISDASQPDECAYSRDAIDSVARASKVIVFKRDGSSVEGVFGGVWKHPIERYILVYNNSLNTAQYRGFVPRLGEPVTIRTSQLSTQGVFHGINRGYVLIRFGDYPDTREVHLDSITMVEGASGQLIYGSTLRRLTQEGSISSMSYVTMSVDYEAYSIPYEAVDTVMVTVSKQGALIGFGIGAVVDAILIATLIHELNRPTECEGTSNV